MGSCVAMHMWNTHKAMQTHRSPAGFHVVPCNPEQHEVATAWDQLCVPCGQHADMAEHVNVPAGLIETTGCRQSS